MAPVAALSARARARARAGARSGYLLAVLAVVSCTDGPGPQLTDSTCPDVDKPTYDNFGKAFFDGYCVACHSKLKKGTDRNGAPATIDFDTLSMIRDNTSDIDRQAAAGATIVNRFMPQPSKAASLDLPIPDDDERYRLGEFMACIVGR